ncbi:TonB family protein [Prosthecochloris sp. SCSIO W1101]|uniref:energy transducer TonB n=1 Tax=Prosthecochloris sp. SCSIO W1101 TaxID=2992242 RepID=UPI00223E1F24|nr:energy transducer TonB [Prosthecochloris sp. SCSIO W1101]UZJ40753.1 TonB family protein [Prosthecochloris sp. SCSIO W1101]
MSNKRINIISFAIAFAFHSACFLFYRIPPLESQAQLPSTAINLSLLSIPAKNTDARQEKAPSEPEKTNPLPAPVKKKTPPKKEKVKHQTIQPTKDKNLLQKTIDETGQDSQQKSSQASASKISSYLAIIRAQIEQNKHYPRFSKKQNHEGTSLIKLHIAKDGSVLQVTMLSSSGYEPLDKATLDAVNKSSPFPAPSDYELGELSLEIPVCYMLN